jgi:hypothetical protein
MNVMLLVLNRKRQLEAKGVMGRVDIITGTLGKAWEEQWIYTTAKKRN